jgi:RNA polymerase sigma factor (sigma-70 family)
MSNTDLIQQCLNGEPLAQHQFYKQHCKVLYALCLRYARNTAEAQDILQESFIRIFKYLHKYEGKGSLEGWLKRITVNVALRTIQTAACKLETSIDTLPETSIEDDTLPLLSAEELLQLIQRLPDGYRIVFNLYAIEGFSHAEIATELHIDESSSRSQLTRARKLLRQWVEELYSFELR